MDCKAMRLMLVATSVFMTSLVFLPVARGQSVQDHYYNLINALFNAYKAEVRPTNDDSTTIVFVNFWLLSIQNLDEKNQVLSTSVILETSWIDPWLTWPPSSYGNISVFRYPQKKLWLPDIVVVNSVKDQRQLGYDQNPMLVNSNGLIQWFPSEITATSCDIDVTYYPFDTQVCDVVVSTWVSTSLQVDLDLEQNATDIVMDRFSPSGTWELSKTRLQSIANDGGFTRLKYSFKLRRLSTFYVMNMIIPVLFLSLTASCVFYLPSDSGEKIGMGMTILLSYAVYLSIISDNMPQTSLQISILSVYLTMLLGITAISVVLSVLILHWHHTPDDTKVGGKMTNITKAFRRVFRFDPVSNGDGDDDASNDVDLLSKRQDGSIATTLRPKSGKISPSIYYHGKIKVSVKPKDITEERITWAIVAETIDTVFFVSISAFIVFVSVLILLILVIGGAYQNAKDW